MKDKNTKNKKLIINFENYKIRRRFDEKKEEAIKLWLAKVGYE